MTRWGAILLVGALVVCGCHRGQQAGDKTGTTKTDVLSRTSQSGPVTATVTLSPNQPTLGDPVELTLTVTAQPGVELHMPAFGEALGRFAITGFVPRTTTRPDGSTEASQAYTLDAPMSGKQKIPALLVEFVDRREHRADADGGLRQAQPETSELLTEELTLDVASVVSGSQADELRPARGTLSEAAAEPRWRRWGPWLGGVFVVLAGGSMIGLVLWRRRRLRAHAAISAFDAAMQRLADLERRGLPAPAQADGWYVDVSFIIRRYLEDCYQLRAPELTTEEFLRVAGESEQLLPVHRGLLRSFLERCDRVKFAAYRPPASESREVLDAARRFLDETAAGGDAHAPAA